MPITHVLLALLVMVVWGVNFIFVKLGLQEISPLLLCALRFFFASVPAIFFIKMPAVSWRMIFYYGIIMFALQFSFLFFGMYIGMTPGMASLIMQVQVFFSLFFAAVFLDESPKFSQIGGALVAFIGISVVAMHFDTTISLAGFLCILAAAASWGLGNLITKKIQQVNKMALVIWGSFFATFPMFILALLLEGPSSFAYTYSHLTWLGVFALAYIVYGSTWIGYALWNWLIGIYPVSFIVPFTLLVPVVGLLSSVLIFGEPLENWKIAATLLVIAGLCINLLGGKVKRFKMVREG